MFCLGLRRCTQSLWLRFVRPRAEAYVIRNGGAPRSRAAVRREVARFRRGSSDSHHLLRTCPLQHTHSQFSLPSSAARLPSATFRFRNMIPSIYSAIAFCYIPIRLRVDRAHDGIRYQAFVRSCCSHRSPPAIALCRGATMVGARPNKIIGRGSGTCWKRVNDGTRCRK